MTKEEKHILKYNVKTYLKEGITHGVIVSRLMRMGYQKATIKKYIKVFSE